MPRGRVVAALGAAQTLAYASSYYLPAVLAAPMAAELGLPRWVIFACLSAAIVVAGLLAPWAGRLVDTRGGRLPLTWSSLLFAAGLALLAATQGPAMLAASWALLGAAMGFGLYDIAFATAVGLYGREARGAITGITLIAGFASTIGWPAMGVAEAWVGWRGACLGWALLHLCLGLPLYRALPEAPAHRAAETAAAPPPSPRALAVVGLVLAAATLVNSGVAANLPDLLQASGATRGAAIVAATLLGPAQVAARVAEFGLLRRLHPVITARLATLAHPLGASVLLGLGAVAAPAFALLHGAGSGMMTIAKGTLPLALFGASGYGRRQGLIAIPVNVANAAAPLLFSLLVARFGAAALLVSAAVSLAGFAALLRLHGASTTPP